MVGIIPIRSFALGNQRLAGRLDDARRQTLGESLALHVASTTVDAGLLPLIVTADVFVTEWAIRSGFPAIDDPATGLDAAVATGIEWAAQSRSSWVAIHTDLPLLRPHDLGRLIDVLNSDRMPLAPSMDGGTSAIGGHDQFATAYGDASFHRHLFTATNPIVVVTTGLLHDLDSFAALESAAEHPRGGWLTEFLT